MTEKEKIEMVKLQSNIIKEAAYGIYKIEKQNCNICNIKIPVDNGKNKLEIRISIKEVKQ